MNEVSHYFSFLILFEVFYLDVDTNSGNYEKMINQEIDSSVLPRSINIDNSVSSPVGTAINLTVYQVKYYRYFSFRSELIVVIVQVFSIIIQIV